MTQAIEIKKIAESIQKPTIHQQTGWTRRHPMQLLQDLRLLGKVKHFDFDINNPEFERYAIRRGVFDGRSDDQHGRHYIRYLTDFGLTRGDYVADENNHISVPDPKTGQRHRLPLALVNTLYDILQIKKARLQDCWEIYTLYKDRV